MAYEHGGQAGWQAKLCDLEYAKQYSTTDNVPLGDPKTVRRFLRVGYGSSIDIAPGNPVFHGG